MSLVLLACFGAPAGFASDFDRAANPWNRFAGEWMPTPEAGGEVARAIDQATERMGFLVAPIARARLLARCRLPRALRMRDAGEDFVIEFVGMETHVMPRSGQPVEQHGRTLSVWVKGGVLVHRGTTSEGTRTNRFSVDPSGSVLTMETVVSSPRLPQPVQFSVRLVRTGLRGE